MLTSASDEAAREIFYPAVLPRLCLNRYYMAEGVKLYCQGSLRHHTTPQICKLKVKLKDSFYMVTLTHRMPPHESCFPAKTWVSG